VPLDDDAELDKWIEGEVLAGVRDIVAGYDHVQLLSRSNLTALNEQVALFFLNPARLFARSGICGSDLHNFTPGAGEVIIRIEKISPSEALNAAMEAPVIARYLATTAKATAEMNAEQVGGQILGIVARMHGMTVAALERDLVDHPEKAGQSLEQSGYKESFAYATDQTKRDRAAVAGDFTDIRVGNADGTSMKGELPAFAAAALLMRGGGGSGRPRKQPGGREEERGSTSKEEEMEKLKEKAAAAYAAKRKAKT
jgi:hypothetical protein